MLPMTSGGGGGPTDAPSDSGNTVAVGGRDEETEGEWADGAGASANCGMAMASSPSDSGVGSRQQVQQQRRSHFEESASFSGSKSTRFGLSGRSVVFNLNNNNNGSDVPPLAETGNVSLTYGNGEHQPYRIIGAEVDHHDADIVSGRSAHGASGTSTASASSTAPSASDGKKVGVTMNRTYFYISKFILSTYIIYRIVCGM